MNRSLRTLLAAVLGLAALVAPATASGQESRDCRRTSVGLTPLTDLGAADYQGEEGGLYPGGTNAVPDGHLALGLQLAAGIRPRDVGGRPHLAGSIGLLGIGVSNTREEFRAFESQAEADPSVNPAVVLVNGARGGNPISAWTDPAAPIWHYVGQQIGRAELSPLQVQAAWVKLPAGGEPEPYPDHADAYRRELAQVLRNLKAAYPNLAVAYLSSRIYGGYGSGEVASSLTREPFAYENGYGVKWTIEDQIMRPEEAGLNADPGRGPVKAPWIAWGPYLWADGLGPDGAVGGVPGRSDGLEWACHHFAEDGIHPSELGAAQVGRLLLEHLRAEPTAQPWFQSGGTVATSSTLAAATTTVADRPRGGTLVLPRPAPIASDPGSRWTWLAWLAVAAVTGALLAFTVVDLVNWGRAGSGGLSPDQADRDRSPGAHPGAPPPPDPSS